MCVLGETVMDMQKKIFTLMERRVEAPFQIGCSGQSGAAEACWAHNPESLLYFYTVCHSLGKLLL
ncbi:hypothetical protein JZ751_019470 [Albula glossodonta]|uniref:Uncharacterized protein n=1 Tax=Albula glossodonta TaxID=121402 RepID=A0A8T2NMV4_9TELE|nr:hypothetical protein JZ751_019470 [Albula glossodonta]